MAAPNLSAPGGPFRPPRHQPDRRRCRRPRTDPPAAPATPAGGPRGPRGARRGGRLVGCAAAGRPEGRPPAPAQACCVPLNIL